MRASIAVALLIVSCGSILAQNQRADWLSRNFYSCHDTAIYEASLLNGGWSKGKQISEAPPPLMHFHVIDTLLITPNVVMSSVDVLIQNDDGMKFVVEAAMVPTREVKTMGFELFSTYARGYSEIPKHWTLQSRKAMETGEISRGMGEDQVICAIGLPEHINDDGNDGLTQEVYEDGARLLYYRRGLLYDIQTFR